MKYGFIKVSAATPEIRVADVKFNTASIISSMKKARDEGSNLLVFPELCLSGATCGDLFNQRILTSACEKALSEIINASSEMEMLTFIGLPVIKNGALYDCAAAVFNGELLAVIPKTNIPSFGESYDGRYFTPAPDDYDEIEFAGDIVPFSAKTLFGFDGMSEFCVACEIGSDLYAPVSPSVYHCLNGAAIIANPSASCEIVARDDFRREMIKAHTSRLMCGYVSANAGEGESTQDAVYTGHDIIAEAGDILCESNMSCGVISSEIDVKKLASERVRTGGFTHSDDDYTMIRFGGEIRETKLTRHINPMPFIAEDEIVRDSRFEKILDLQSLGLKKRIEHTHASKLVVGVSGGLDSTLAMIICSRALTMLGRAASDLIAVTMPCFGTTKRTRSNAELLAEKLGAELRTVDITESVTRHFVDIGHDIGNTNVVFENSQARERTQVIMDIANGVGGMVVGTGDLSELALGWATYNGDHMSMYGVNGDVPKTLVRRLVSYYADTCGDSDLKTVLMSIVDTPVSPELLPAENGEISQKTENIVGPYELHDFFLYNLTRWGFEPSKIFVLAKYAFKGEYSDETILKWLKTFCRRFFTQQFKRSCLPDGPKVGSVALSPRGDLRMPSDAVSELWLSDLDSIEL